MSHVRWWHEWWRLCASWRLSPFILRCENVSGVSNYAYISTAIQPIVWYSPTVTCAMLLCFTSTSSSRPSTLSTTSTSTVCFASKRLLWNSKTFCGDVSAVDCVVITRAICICCSAASSNFLIKNSTCCDIRNALLQVVPWQWFDIAICQFCCRMMVLIAILN